jgi:hypothetical protein
MNKGEPPSSSCPAFSRFMIGRNSRGNWVVQDQQGLRGGLFLDRTQALKFIKSENGNGAHAVIMVPGVLELDMSPVLRKNDFPQFSINDAQPALRRVA